MVPFSKLFLLSLLTIDLININVIGEESGSKKSLSLSLSTLAPLFFAVCCPAGALAQNGVCYCTKEIAEKSPFACRVICERYNLSRPPAEGGCVCPSGFVGSFCDRRSCRYETASGRRMFCVVDDCTGLPNANVDSNRTDLYPVCPCFNGGYIEFDDSSEMDVGQTCTCPDGFSGDLCQLAVEEEIEYTADQVTANTFLGIIAVAILSFSVVFCCASRHQRKKQEAALRHLDYHRHYRSPQENSSVSTFVPALTACFPSRGSTVNSNVSSNNNQNSKRFTTNGSDIVLLRNGNQKSITTPLVSITHDHISLDDQFSHGTLAKPL